MGEKAEYRSSLRSKKLIREALSELVREKPLDRITVTDIVTHADINRGTFYAHYRDVAALVTAVEDEITGRVLEIADGGSFADFCRAPERMLRAVSEYLRSDLPFFEAVADSRVADPYLVKLRGAYFGYIMGNGTIPAGVRADPRFRAATMYNINGAMYTYAECLRGHLDIPLDALADTLGAGVRGCLAGFMEN